MASSMFQPSFEPVRPQTHQRIHTTPVGSPRIHRSASQQSLNLPPSSNYSPSTGHEQSPHPMSAYPQAYRAYQPASMSLPTGGPYYQSVYPSTAPPLSFYPNTTPIYDPRGSQPMIRTVSHAHPMNSATDATVSSRYSSSPHSATGPLNEVPATASGQQLNPYHALGFNPPSFNFNQNDPDSKHINPNIFQAQPSSSYSMSRSTSGASDMALETTRLVTPAFEYRQDRLSPAAHDLRKVSDTLGDGGRKLWSSTLTPSFDLQPHSHQYSPHPQPDSIFFGDRGYGNDQYTMSAERGDTKADILAYGDTEYERERQAQIMDNKKLLEDVGLGNPGTFGFRAERNSSGTGSRRSRKASTPFKPRLRLDAPVRASPRIREMGRNVSYANLDDDQHTARSDDEDEYDSDTAREEEDDFRPSKRSRGSKSGYRTKSASFTNTPKMIAKPQLSLWGLLQVYADIPHLFPLFYYTLNNDLTINSDSVPLIGSIPSTCTPMEKADTLQAFFHRGRRVLAQLDAFTARCDRKYEGPEQKWPELDYHTRIAVRDVRRKIVERCENYKYTRRDILDKFVGKNKWQSIDSNLIEWKPGMTQNDPAGDLANVTLTLPTPPPEVYNQQYRYQNAYPDRIIKAFPRSRMSSSIAPRIASITMGEPEDVYSANPQTANYPPPMSGMQMYSAYSSAAPPMYGEDQVPLEVQMPPASAPVNMGLSTSSSMSRMIDSAMAPTATSNFNYWDDVRGIKRSRSQDDNDAQDDQAQSQSPESEEDLYTSGNV
ncbi:uncharacterized protein IL334_007761 [Kwoniella shivajii]|uniref:Uncharacterized protein n=1 Tax=Kwoniella shivajii TaxID=564305 RepID=A0ABZ1D9K1_9TREE|nr:hypothetical protein IL334_007761 [Kwoniella shivajii]